jgi:5'-3' exonuclease
MILVDLNQVLISNLMAQTRGKSDVKPNKDMIRSMVLNSLRGFNIKFKEQYGDMVLCSDAGDPWRRDIFPNYKHGRRKSRVDGPFDWNNIFEIITEIKNEIRDNFPYIVMYVEKCEADDIIATLVKEQKDEKYLIVSGDKDFIQLHSYKNVKQFSPILKGFVGEGVDPKQFLYEQIIKGDRSDGVPNVLSPDDIFLQEGARQKPINKKRLEEFKNIERNATIETNIKENYQRNKTLIDLSQIPDHIEKNIINTFTNYKVNDRTLLFNYFIENKLRSLIENINDF